MISYIEQLVKQFFTIYIKDKCFYNYRPKWLKGLELDLFFPSYNLGIEVNGANHFLSNLQKYNDKKKQILCRKNNVKLIVINYPVELFNNNVINRLKDITKLEFNPSLLPEELFQQMLSYKCADDEYYQKKYNTKLQNRNFYIKMKKKKLKNRILKFNIAQEKERYKQKYKLLT